MPVDQDKLSLLVVKGLDEIPIKLEEFGVIDNNTKGPIVSTIMKISPEGKVRDAFKDFVLRVNVAPLEDVGEADVHLVALPVPLKEMSCLLRSYKGCTNSGRRPGGSCRRVLPHGTT